MKKNNKSTKGKSHELNCDTIYKTDLDIDSKEILNFDYSYP